MSDRATPRPWRTGGRESERHAIRILNAEGGLVAEARAAAGSWEDSKRHAELIVTAVNAHDRLTRENAKMRRALQAVLSNPVVDGFSARIRDHAKQNGLTNPLEQAEAALAAEGEE